MRQLLEAENRQSNYNRTNTNHNQNESYVRWKPSRLFLDTKGDANRRGRDRYHTAGQDTKQYGIENIINRCSNRPGNLAKIPVQCQAGPNSNRCANKRPGQHSHQVAKKQPYKYIKGTCTPDDEQRAYDELGTGDVLTRINTRKVLARMKLVLGDWLALKFVKRIQSLYSTTFVVSSHLFPFPFTDLFNLALNLLP
ncbi:hypothetical protein ES703_125054 [subsurface metagenome]